MADRIDVVLVALNELHGASVTLTEFARELATNPDAHLSDFEEVPELLADALATALDCLPEGSLGESRTQLLGALRKYLEGWAG